MRREYDERAATVGADKAYDTADFVETCAAFPGRSHVARNISRRRSNIADDVAASASYRASQVHRKRIEEVFARAKTVAGLSKTRHRGLARVGWQFALALAAYDLPRVDDLAQRPMQAVSRHGFWGCDVWCDHPGQRHREHEGAGRPMYSMSCELVLVAGRVCDSPGCAESADP